MHFSKLNYAELFFVLGIILTLSTRLFSNQILKLKYHNTNQGDPIDLVPRSQSFYSVLGALSTLFSIILAFSSSVWVGLIFVLIYALTNLVPSKLNAYRKLFHTGNFKKCAQCKDFYNVSYFSINENNQDNLNNVCVKCSDPKSWKIVQDIKSSFK